MTTELDTSPEELARIAEDAYLFGFPIVLMEVTRRLTTNVPAGIKPGFGPMNLFTHMVAFPPGDFKEVVRPNFDTLYSILWFDLSEEPIVVSVPDTAGRYYMLPFMDMWTDVFALVGRRTTTNGPADYSAVHEVQAGFVATPLSVWPAGPTVPTSCCNTHPTWSISHSSPACAGWVWSPARRSTSTHSTPRHATPSRPAPCRRRPGWSDSRPCIRSTDDTRTWANQEPVGSLAV